MMHGQKTIKLCNAEQPKQVYQHKNIKIKLHKNNAAIWYNKTCRARQLTPTYVNIPLLIGALYGSIQSGTIPDTVNIQLSS
jgi:hypothetical protein